MPIALAAYWENIPYSSSEPNESDTVNRQIRNEKLKYVLKFYIGVQRYTSRDIAHAQLRLSTVVPLCKI